MYLCNDKHDEICYEGRICPACEAVREKDKLIVALEEKVKWLEEDVDDLRDQLKEAIQ